MSYNFEARELPLTSKVIRESWKVRLADKIKSAEVLTLGTDVIEKINKGKVLIILGAGIVRNVWTNFLRAIIEIADHLRKQSKSATVRTILERLIRITREVLDLEVGLKSASSKVKSEKIDKLCKELSEFLSKSGEIPEAFQMKMSLTQHYLKTPSCTRLSITVGCVALLLQVLDNVWVLDLTYAHDLPWACYHLGIPAQTVSSTKTFGKKTILKPHGVNYEKCTDCPISDSIWIFSCCFDCPSLGPFSPNIVFVPPGAKRDDPYIYKEILRVALDVDVLLIIAFSGRRDPQIASIIKQAINKEKTVINVDRNPYSTAFYSKRVIALKGGATSIMPRIVKSLDQEIWQYISSQNIGGINEWQPESNLSKNS
jgi:hypothetical protein